MVYAHHKALKLKRTALLSLQAAPMDWIGEALRSAGMRARTAPPIPMAKRGTQ